MSTVFKKGILVDRIPKTHPTCGTINRGKKIQSLPSSAKKDVFGKKRKLHSELSQRQTLYFHRPDTDEGSVGDEEDSSDSDRPAKRARVEEVEEVEDDNEIWFISELIISSISELKKLTEKIDQFSPHGGRWVNLSDILPRDDNRKASKQMWNLFKKHKILTVPGISYRGLLTKKIDGLIFVKYEA